jgi:hypothetical protein
MDNRASDEYSFMKTISRAELDPKRYSVKHFADSVFPTPVRPRSKKLHFGRNDRRLTEDETEYATLSHFELLEGAEKDRASKAELDRQQAKSIEAATRENL